MTLNADPNKPQKAQAAQHVLHQEKKKKIASRLRMQHANPLPEQGNTLKEVHSLEKSTAALDQGPPSPVFEIIVRVTAISDAG
jgi:hypothetical protein